MKRCCHFLLLPSFLFLCHPQPCNKCQSVIEIRFFFLCYEDIRVFPQCRHLVFIIYLCVSFWFFIIFLFFIFLTLFHTTLYTCTLVSAGRFILHISKLFVMHFELFAPLQKLTASLLGVVVECLSLCCFWPVCFIYFVIFIQQ